MQNVKYNTKFLALREFYAGKRVMITGHTGFKGGWLALCLHSLGAEIHGYSLDPPTQPNIFTVADVAGIVSSDIRADLTDLQALRDNLDIVNPEIIFHLAAQSLVRESYKEPLLTLRTNVLGTANVLEAARDIANLKAIVVVTTDKVYACNEKNVPYSENDALGGHDPYSASKAAAEIVTDSYRKSFFFSREVPVNIATARSGNVIGGGDWAADRLIPDCLRAFMSDKPICLRYPCSVRPWQHVLEPLFGYLLLGAKLCGTSGAQFARPWNFGPAEKEQVTVLEIAKHAADIWGENAKVEVDKCVEHPHESNWLKLDISNACGKIGWQPRWSWKEAVQSAMDWYKAWLAGKDMRDYSLSQIKEY